MACDGRLRWPGRARRVSGGTPEQHMHGATCFSGASVDKVSFNLSPRSVDVPPPGEPGSGSPASNGAPSQVELQVKEHRVPRTGKSLQG